jgi:hypothetical protein
MRAASSIRLLLVPAALLAAGCDDTPSPLDPTIAKETTPAAQENASSLSAPRGWAAGYLHAGAPTAPSYAPVPYLSYNQSGGAMNITKPAGTTGRYIVTFRGLSAVLGSKSTVHVTEYGLGDTYCKPTNGRLVYDKIEVRCIKASTRQAANAAFTVVVLGKPSAAPFAYAHQPTSNGYQAAAAGTWNPGGATTVYRRGVGEYHVVFTGLALGYSPTTSGHVQVNAVGTGKAHCVVEDWGRVNTSDLNLQVMCYTPAGVPVDSKFTVLFLIPDSHVAYTYANQPSATNYSPQAQYTSNPAGGGATITRNGVGKYTVIWPGVDAEIIDGGTVQVTAAALYNTQCKATSLFDSGVIVHCFAPNGAPRDAEFTVLFGS